MCGLGLVGGEALMVQSNAAKTVDELFGAVSWLVEVKNEH